MARGKKRPLAKERANVGPQTPKAKAAPVGPQVPKAIVKFMEADGKHSHPVFSFSLADNTYAERWGWPLLTAPDALRLIQFLRMLATTPWREIRLQTSGKHLRHHPQPITSLCSAARRRLRELELDDLDTEIFRFRDGGKKRLWGFDRDGIFYAVWWDPDHEVYPTEPN